LGAALAKDCTGADLRSLLAAGRCAEALDVEVEEADAVLGDLGAHRAQAVGLVQVSALAVDDGLQPASVPITTRCSMTALAVFPCVEAVVGALVGALDGALLLGHSAALASSVEEMTAT
jgi:hypothetical protein